MSGSKSPASGSKSPVSGCKSPGTTAKATKAKTASSHTSETCENAGVQQKTQPTSEPLAIQGLAEKLERSLKLEAQPATQEKRKATKTPERLVNEAVYQLQKKYTELGQPKMSEKMWEKLLVQTMEQMGVKAEPQAKIQEVFSDFVPAPKYADVMLERKGLIELKLGESWPSAKGINQLKGYMIARGFSHGAIVCISESSKPTVFAKMLIKGKTRSQDYPVHDMKIFRATKLSDPTSDM